MHRFLKSHFLSAFFGLCAIVCSSGVCQAQTVFPFDVDVHRGLVNPPFSVLHFAFSDDIQASLNPGFVVNPTESPVCLEFRAFVPRGMFNLTIRTESSANTPNIDGTIEVLNWITQEYEVVDTFDEAFPFDNLRESVLPGPDFFYVNFFDNNSISYRMRWDRKPKSFIIADPWEVRVDLAVIGTTNN